jgi:hypothetical protein
VPPRKDLSSLAATCEFGNELEDHVTDQFLHGLTNEEVVSQLAMGNLPFDRFVAKACQYESAVDYAKGAIPSGGTLSAVK